MAPPRAVAEVARTYSDQVEILTAYGAEMTNRAAQTGLRTGDAPRWRDSVVDAAPTLLELQRAAVDQADSYLDDVLSAQGADPVADAKLATEAFVDQTDGGGSWLRNLVYAPPSAYGDAIAGGYSPAQAAARATYVANAVTVGGIRDMARSAVSVGMATRKAAKSYVRALRGASCPRCAILAGRHYRKGAFSRHPRCDCYMIPAAEDVAGDWSTDPLAYFHSLATAAQDAIFGPGAAEAIRSGADISQVVNAYDGVTTVGGHRVTTTGTTSRGLAGQRRPDGIRLLPDEILAQAQAGHWSHQRLLDTLFAYGYVI